MSYINADSLLPPELVREIQKYVQGSAVYIPRPDEKRMGWGHANGTRRELDQRNESIRAAKAEGKTVREIADEHHLSVDAIRKILNDGYRRSA